MVPVAVMQIRVVRVAVPQRNVAVPVDVGFASVPFESMLMPVVLVMHMRVRVLHLLVGVLMLVPFREVQPDAGGHEQRGNPEREGG